MEKQRGKFIVIDGTDGSGKATQTQLLAEKLWRAGFNVAIADFPQYNTKSAGMVEEYLSGKYGSPEEVGPYRASIFYACDRYDASFKIKTWLAEGKIVISNRYVTANMGHQGGKISNDLERKHYFDWLYQLEYEIFDIPKPDLNIILHVDAEISQQLAQSRLKQDWNGKTNDIHQNDLNHLKKAEQTYSQIAQNFPNFTLIECVADGRMLSREDISNLIWEKIIRLFKPAPYSANFKELHNSISPTGAEENILKLKVEKISSWAKLPTRAYEYDAGLDLYSADYHSLTPGKYAIIKTGIKIALPKGFVGLVWDKGGLAKNGIHSLAGVIDAGFRGEVTVELINLGQDIFHIAPGQKIAQLLIQKIELPEIVEGRVADETDRKDGCFGSSGLF
ncbi:MAG: dUTP diphosphatase [Patescibacteria group bacterium]|jgi:dTMP kinase